MSHTRTPTGYSRTIFMYRNEMGRPLTDADAIGMLGTELSVSLGETVVASGTVTAVRIVDAGERMQVTVENNGRCCLACHTVYPTGRADQALITVQELQDQNPVTGDDPAFYDLPRWSRVCRDAATCWDQRVRD